jgi:hypothetical protein
VTATKRGRLASLGCTWTGIKRKELKNVDHCGVFGGFFGEENQFPKGESEAARGP